MTTQTPILDRVIQVPVIRTRMLTGGEGVELAYCRREDDMEPGTFGDYWLDSVDSDSDPLSDYASATRIDFADEDESRLGFPSGLTPPYPLTMTWADSRSVTWTVTARQGYGSIIGTFDPPGHTLTVEGGVVTGDDSTAPPDDDVDIEVGSGASQEVTEEALETVWAQRVDLTAADQIQIRSGSYLSATDRRYLIRADLGYQPVIDHKVTDEDGYERRLKGWTTQGRNRFFELVLEVIGG